MATSGEHDTARTGLGTDETVAAAVEAHRRGWTPIPLVSRTKRPFLPDWTHLNWSDVDDEQVARDFEGWARSGAANLGVALGQMHNGLVDVDIDLGVAHLGALREIASVCLPWTAMRSGRPGNPDSHHWYRVPDDELPSTRRYKTHDKKVIIELRSTDSQTMVPPSVHDKTDDVYRWEGEPWGGDEGPAEVEGRRLACQVALFALVAHLYYVWPGKGSRHDAYLALAGGLLRRGDGVHPLWERNIGVLIEALAAATRDGDGARVRVAECVETTLTRLRAGQPVQGWPTLAREIGDDENGTAVASIRRLVDECERLAGWSPSSVPANSRPTTPDDGSISGSSAPGPSGALTLVEPGVIDPMAERANSWDIIELDAYLSGQYEPPQPTLLARDDGQCLLYGGRVNLIAGASGRGKTWVALTACLQEMEKGGRVLYLDFEDEPGEAVKRLKLMGAAPDDILRHFFYVRPEMAVSAMQRDRWGKPCATPDGNKSAKALDVSIARADPTLIVVDGTTSLYSLHGLSTNDSANTEVIALWLRMLTRGGKTAVLLIDHTVKNAERGALPIGSQHKVSFVGGVVIQVHSDKGQKPRKGEIRSIELLLLKDRPGEVSEHCQDVEEDYMVAAHVLMDSRTPERIDITVTDRARAELIMGPLRSANLTVDLSHNRGAELSEKRAEADEALMWVFGGELGLQLTTKQIEKMLEPNLSANRVRDALARQTSRGELIKKVRGSQHVYQLSEVTGYR